MQYQITRVSGEEKKQNRREEIIKKKINQENISELKNECLRNAKNKK